MKKLLFFLFLALGMNAWAQDVIITKEGDALKVFNVEVGTETVFYQESEDANSPTRRMAKADILMIKFQDGRRMMIGEEGNASQPVATPQPAATPDAADPQANAQVVQHYQTPVQFLGNETPSKANLVMVLFSPLEGAVFADKNMEVEVEANAGWTDKKGKRYEGVSGYWNATLRLKNKSNKTIYLDLGNSFIIRGTESVPYYVPTVTSNTAGATVGGAVNIIRGLSIGGGSSNYSTTTVMAQRIIGIPPGSTKELSEVSLMALIRNENPFPKAPLTCNRFKGMAYMLFPEPVRSGQVIDCNPNDDTMQFGFVIGYAEDEAQTNPQSLHATFGLSRIIGLPQKASSMYNWINRAEIDVNVSLDFHDRPYLLLRQKED